MLLTTSGTRVSSNFAQQLESIQQEGSSRMRQNFSNVYIVACVVASVFAILQLSFESSKMSSTILGKRVAATRRKYVKESVKETIQQITTMPKNEFPIPTNSSYFHEMQNRTAPRSIGHMKKFFARKDQVSEKFDQEKRFKPVLRNFAAIILSDKFAFLHVWKCGGTTVELLTDTSQLALSNPHVQERQWVALVRDPIDRFISAWAECGVRLYEHEIDFKGFERMSALNWLEDDYNFRLRAFLREVQDYLPPARSCHTHAFPQANFMMNDDGYIDDHIMVVGDLSEMKQTLELAKLRLGPEKLVIRDASEDVVKNHYFQSRRNELSDVTLIELCKFFAIDYFLFDFVPPRVCVEDGGPLADMF